MDNIVERSLLFRMSLYIVRAKTLLPFRNKTLSMKYLCIITLFLVLISCQNQNDYKKLQTKKQVLIEKSPSEIGFIHNVYIWLVDDISIERRAAFQQSLIKLSKVPTIVNSFYGPPAMTDRPVVDNTYDYAWVTMFEDKKGHDAYQIDPLHLEFVKENEDIFKRVKVYDNLVLR